MGSPNNEEGRYDIEGPRHRVNIGYPLAVGVYEVTFSEWYACVNAGGCDRFPDDEGWGRGNRPVINVSWEDAQSYVRWLSARTDHRYGLLSESEWEYVARAGTITPFYFGSTISTDQANYNGDYTYDSGRKGVYRGKTVPVGSFSANAWGVHDMHGNVWEWVEDCWNYSYEGAPADGSAWESGDCDVRVLRGGSWNNSPGFSCVRRFATGLPPDSGTSITVFELSGVFNSCLLTSLPLLWGWERGGDFGLEGLVFVFGGCYDFFCGVFYHNTSDIFKRQYCHN